MSRFKFPESWTEEQRKTFEEGFYGYPHVYEPPKDEELAKYYKYGSNKAIKYDAKCKIPWPDEF